MKIILTEEQIKKLVNERLGSASGLFTVAQKIYDNIIKEIKSYGENFDLETPKDFDIYDDYNYGDIEKSELNVIIIGSKTKTGDDNEIGLESVHVSNELISDDNFNLVNKKSNKINISFYLKIPSYKKTTREDVLTFFKIYRKKIVSVISHELGHIYSHEKRKYASLAKKAEYDSYSNVMTIVPSISQFFFNLYFISECESIAEIPELTYSILNLPPKEFRNFFEKNKKILTLKKISAYEFEDLKNDVMGDISLVKLFLKKMAVDVKNKTDEELVMLALHYHKIYILNKQINVIKTESEFIIASNLENRLNFYFAMMNKKPPKFVLKTQKIFRKYEKISDINQTERFYREKIKDAQRSAKHILRKVAKLYDLSQDKIGENNVNYKVNQKNSNKNVPHNF